MAQRQQPRTVEAWDWLKALHDSIYAKPGLENLVAIISFDRQMPSVFGGPINIKAGTSVVWNHLDDELDHHWEVRRLEKRAAGLLAMLPVIIEGDGTLDTECWVEMHRDRIIARVARSDCEPSDSTFNLQFGRGPEGWTTSVFITAVTDMPLVDIAAAIASDVNAALTVTRWETGGLSPTGMTYQEDDEEIRIDLPVEAYGHMATVPQTEKAGD